MKTLLCALLLAAPAVKSSPAPSATPEEVLFEPADNSAPVKIVPPEQTPARTPRPKPTPFPYPKYETSKLPAGTSDAEVIHDLVLHEIFTEYFYGPWPQQTMWIVSDSGHWDELLAKNGPSSEARRAILSSKSFDHDALVTAVNGMVGTKNESVGDPGTFDGPITHQLVASKDTPGPFVMKPNPTKADRKPVWASLSAIGYSEDHSIAVECGSSWIGSFVGGGDCFVLEKKPAGWKIAERHVIYRQ